MNNKTYEIIDFTNQIINNKITPINEYKKSETVLIISNFDTVKNLLLLARINFKLKIKGKPMKKFVLLTTNPKSIRGNVIKNIILKFGVNIEFDQTKKNDLIKKCNYLFIPSYTEYLPLVALEAFSFSKPVISYYYIIGLSNFKSYKFIRL
jgi:glycosyltransferase involved in cell wall biosynthesis